MLDFCSSPAEVLFATHYHPVSKKAVEDTAKVSEVLNGETDVFFGTI
jgi:hypothetical protein